MRTEKFKTLFDFAPKSNIKAGDGLDVGNFPFYTSSSILSKRIDKALYNDEALIFGTGGSASVHCALEPFSTSTDCIVAITKSEEFNAKFVYYYLFGNKYILERGFKGAGLKHISKKYIENIDIPVLPFETQNKIVAVLDKANTLVSKREQSIQFLDELLRATFLDMFGDPAVNTKKLKLIPFHLVIEKIDAGWSPKCEENQRSNNDEWAVLKQSAVSRRFFNPIENKLLPTGINIKKEITAQKGDLLLSRKNSKEYVGSAAYVFEEYEKLLLPDTIFNLRYNPEKVSGLYLFYLINDNNYQKVIQNLRTGAAGSMPNISQQKLMEHSIPLPEISEQKKFEDIVFNTYSKKKKVLVSKVEVENLFNSILQKVFNGQLNFNVDFELDALIHEIDLQKKENDLSKIVGDIAFLQRLVDKLNSQEFKEKELYDKAKHGVFQLLKAGDKVEQIVKKIKINYKIESSLILSLK